MKRFLFLVMAVVALASCSKDNEEPNIMDYDLTPIEFLFDITNADGESLIDKDSPAYDSVFIANTYIKFQGKEYKMEEDAKVDVKPTTRAYYERFHGMMIHQYTIDRANNITKSLARIGPFLSDYDWKTEEIEIHWGDNSEDKIVFTSVITSRPKNQTPTFSQKVLFNGKDCTETFFGYNKYMQVVKGTGKEK